MIKLYPVTVIKCVNDAYCFIRDCKPFKIRKAVLSVPGEAERDIYLVALRGTNRSFSKEDPLGLPVCLRSGCSKGNIYFDLVKKAILDEIPSGSEIVFIGHSLGGMVSQQLGADEELRTGYKILNILTMGSPYIAFRGKKCPLHRMADTADAIPMLLSLALVANPFIKPVAHERGGYFGHPVMAHCDSYEKSEKWKKYDCFGIVNGGRVITVESGQAE